jgi:hypothetical protein
LTGELDEKIMSMRRFKEKNEAPIVGQNQLWVACCWFD